MLALRVSALMSPARFASVSTEQASSAPALPERPPVAVAHDAIAVARHRFQRGRLITVIAPRRSTDRRASCSLRIIAVTAERARPAFARASRVSSKASSSPAAEGAQSAQRAAIRRPAGQPRDALSDTLNRRQLPEMRPCQNDSCPAKCAATTARKPAQNPKPPTTTTLATNIGHLQGREIRKPGWLAR